MSSGNLAAWSGWGRDLAELVLLLLVLGCVLALSNVRLRLPGSQLRRFSRFNGPRSRGVRLV